MRLLVAVLLHLARQRAADVARVVPRRVVLGLATLLALAGSAVVLAPGVLTVAAAASTVWAVTVYVMVEYEGWRP